jgi:hypothetical protein
MSTLCYMFVNDLQNSEQCTMLVSVLGKGSMCIVRTRHINSVGYVPIFKWGFLVWQKLTGVLGFLRHFFLHSLEILVSSLWLEHIFLSCRAIYYTLGSVSGRSRRSGDYMFWKSLVRNARCASFQNLTSLILWIYFISLWTRCDFSEFSFSLFFQMPERVHKNVEWKQSPNLHSEARSFVASACQGDYGIMQSSIGATFWGMLSRCYCEVWVHSLGTALNISYYLNCCWFELATRGRAITRRAICHVKWMSVIV